MTGRLAGVRVAATAIVTFALVGCTASPVSTPTPTVTTVDPSALIGQTIDPVDTTWSGTDSAGDLTVFTLKADHGVKVTYGTHSFDQQGDTWSVASGALSLHVYIDAKNGYLDYAGMWDATKRTIAATGTTSLSSRTITVTLTEK